MSKHTTRPLWERCFGPVKNRKEGTSAGGLVIGGADCERRPRNPHPKNPGCPRVGAVGPLALWARHVPCGCHHAPKPPRGDHGLVQGLELGGREPAVGAHALGPPAWQDISGRNPSQVGWGRVRPLTSDFNSDIGDAAARTRYPHTGARVRFVYQKGCRRTTSRVG